MLHRKHLCFSVSDCRVGKNKHALLLLLAFIFLHACADIDNLSDSASITSFSIISYAPTTVQLGEPVLENNIIRIPFSGNTELFPVTITAALATDGYVADILGDDYQNLVFENASSIKEISLITKSGVPVTYQIRFDVDLGTSTIDHFAINSYSPASAEVPDIGMIEPLTATITVMMAREAFPLTVTPSITLLSGAYFDDYTPGDNLVFDDATSTHSLTVKNNDGSELQWTVRLQIAPQLPNSSFDHWYFAWNGSNADKEQIGVSATDAFWGTANDPVVGFETRKVPGELGVPGDYGAQLKTNIKDVIGIRKLGSASLFTGFFKLNLDYLDTPVRMTKMGRPFIMRPKKVIFSAKYIVGYPYYMKDPNNDNNIIQVPGDDRGDCNVRIEQWTDASGKILYNYNAKTPDEYEKVIRTVIGNGVLVIGPTPTWTRMEVPITYTSSLQATHIVVSFASSKDGMEFRGGDGSTLTVDNCILIYD